MQNHLFFILNSLFYIFILLLYILYYYFIFTFSISLTIILHQFRKSTVIYYIIYSGVPLNTRDIYVYPFSWGARNTSLQDLSP